MKPNPQCTYRDAEGRRCIAPATRIIKSNKKHLHGRAMCLNHVRKVGNEVDHTTAVIVEPLTTEA